MRTLRLTILFLGYYFASASSQQPGGPTPEEGHLRNSCAPQVWMASIFPASTRLTSTVPCTNISEVHVTAARGEYTSFQIAISANNTLVDNVDAYASDLFGPSGASVSRQNVVLYREHEVYVAKGSPDTGGENRPLGKGWYPDALIPLRFAADGKRPENVAAGAPFSIKPATSEVLWTDIYVPRDATPGEYSGVISLAGSPGVINVPVHLTVWRFTLPAEPSLKSSFGLHSPNDRNPDVQRLLLRHKVMPLFAMPEIAQRGGGEDGLNITGLRLFGKANPRSCTMDPAPRREAISEAARPYPPDLTRYVYSADEVGNCPGLFETIRDWGRAIHTTDPAIKNLVTMAPVPALLDDGTGTGRSAIDIWVVLPPAFEAHRAQIDQVRKKGDQVWSYTALVQDSYSPKWELDFAPVNYRILPGFLSQSMGLTGLLYWRADRWDSTAWEVAPSYKVASSDNAYPGEGMLVYPGQAVGLPGVLPSMRLKWIRDGVQDYEYVSLLKQLGLGDWALDISRKVAANWHQWTKDPNALEAARYELGCRLDRLAANQAGDGR